jgi:hypothetical protein
MVSERRRYPRVTLRQPIRGAVGPARVYVLDTSVGGLRLAHQANLPAPGEFCRVEVPTDLGPIKLDCQIVRTVHRDHLFHTGVSIVSADRQSTERLRSLCVELQKKMDN